MKITLISLAAFLTFSRAGEPQIFDLGNGAEIVVKDGIVEVSDRPGASAKSASNSVSSSSDGHGGTTATVTSERDGQRVTRTVTISPDGKVSVEGTPAQTQPADPPRAGGWMGVHTVPVSDALRAQVDLPEGQGIVLEVVSPEGPAAKAGLAAHDILLTLNGLPLVSVEEFRAALRAAMPQQELPVTYLRKGKQAQAAVTLGTPPAQPEAGSETAAQKMLREMQERMANGKSGKTTVVGPDGKTRTVDGADAFDLLLNDPTVPETMKEQIRRARESMNPKAEVPTAKP